MAISTARKKFSESIPIEMTARKVPLTASKISLVLANRTLASYPQGGGHWACFLQYLFGLNALGHDVYWLEILPSSGNRSRDQRLIEIFFGRFKRYGFKDRCALLLCGQDLTEPTLEACHAYGMSKNEIKKIARDTDLLWNFSCSLRQPLLALFNRRVLIDLDPGHLQVSALTWEMGIDDHDVFLSVGTKLPDGDCSVPRFRMKWNPFVPFVHLPQWTVAPDPGDLAPFTSVTQWTWDYLVLKKRSLSISKRDAYLRYLDLPARVRRPFELAANIPPRDSTGDRELLMKMGWKLARPHAVARSPASYQAYIAGSRAELSCPKPIYRELNTGWFSDRSVAYLASGRPVLAEDTGFSAHIPTGRGLLCFKDMSEAVAGVQEIDGNYAVHARAARELAEECFSSEKWLPFMLSACGW
jgi:hypothetical protein